jgi:hypothetical protein
MLHWIKTGAAFFIAVIHKLPNQQPENGMGKKILPNR